ncbi:MAG: sulfur carrier protein ThiS [Streptosporangiaceae bacterium]
MIVIVNGDRRDLPAGTTVEAVVSQVTQARTGVAVALNDEVVRRSAWASTTVNDADRVEILTAVQGG